MTRVATAPQTLALSSSSTQLRHFEKHGYLIVRRVLSAADITELAAEADELACRTELIDTNNIRCRWQNHVDTGECLFECLDPVIDLGPCCRRIAHDVRLLKILASIYGE